MEAKLFKKKHLLVNWKDKAKLTKFRRQHFLKYLQKSCDSFRETLRLKDFLFDSKSRPLSDWLLEVRQSKRIRREEALRKDFFPIPSPLFSRFSLYLNDPESWRTLLKIPAIKTLCIKLYPKGRWIPHLKKNRPRFLRYLSSKNSLQNVKIENITSIKDRLPKILPLIEELLTLRRPLKSFRVSGWKALESESDIVKKAITHLQIETIFEKPSIQPCVLSKLLSFENLNTLDISLPSTNSEISQLSLLSKFEKLKTITVQSCFYEKPYVQKSFIENLILPSSLESITLIFNEIHWGSYDETREGWKNKHQFLTSDSVMRKFYARWKEFTNLKNLELHITERGCATGCSELTSVFLTMILEQITTLQTLRYVHTLFHDKDCRKETSAIKKPLDLNFLWKGLRCSRLTIQDVFIGAPKIVLNNFSEIDTRMPKLKSFTLSAGSLLSVKNIMKLWSNSVRIKKGKRPLKLSLQNTGIWANKGTILDMYESLYELPANLEVAFFSEALGLNLDVLLGDLYYFLDRCKFTSPFSLHLRNKIFYGDYAWKTDDKKILEKNIKFQESGLFTGCDIRFDLRKRWPYVFPQGYGYEHLLREDYSYYEDWNGSECEYDSLDEEDFESRQEIEEEKEEVDTKMINDK